VLRQTLSYAGDARVMDLQPNEERLISQAVNLGTEVKPGAAADSGGLTQVKVAKGVLYATTKLRETKTYAAKNRNLQGRAVLSGHSVKDQFQRVGTTMLVQTARNAYRFEVKVPAAETATQAATEERYVGPAVQLTDSPDEQVRVFLQNPVVSAKVQEGLKKAMEKVRLPRQVEEANGPGAAPSYLTPESARPRCAGTPRPPRPGRGGRCRWAVTSATPPAFFPAWRGRETFWRGWWTSVDLWWTWRVFRSIKATPSLLIAYTQLMDLVDLVGLVRPGGIGPPGRGGKHHPQAPAQMRPGPGGPPGPSRRINSLAEKDFKLVNLTGV
jgi:hypothetical protein